MSDDTDTEAGNYGDDEIDSLDDLQIDAFGQQGDSELTARAFGAIGALTEVFSKVRDGYGRIEHERKFLSQLRRITQIVGDYYAATGRG